MSDLKRMWVDQEPGIDVKIFPPTCPLPGWPPATL